MDNETRRNRAITALEAYSEEDDDLVSNIIDLLTDLLHLCKQQEIDFQACLLSAEINFESEKYRTTLKKAAGKLQSIHEFEKNGHVPAK